MSSDNPKGALYRKTLCGVFFSRTCPVRISRAAQSLYTYLFFLWQMTIGIKIADQAVKGWHPAVTSFATSTEWIQAERRTTRPATDRISS